jgi:hypothetical protein
MTSWPDHLPSGNQNRFWRNGNQIDTAFILARSDFVKVHGSFIHRFIRRWKFLGTI